MIHQAIEPLGLYWRNLWVPCG